MLKMLNFLAVWIFFVYAYLYILVYLVPWQRFNHYFDFFCIFFGSNENKCIFDALLIQKTNINFNLLQHGNNQNKRNEQFKELH